MSAFSVTGKNWIFKEFNESEVNNFIENYSLTEITAKLLSIRARNIDDINLFLNPRIKNLLPNPARLKGMNEALERTFNCIKKGEVIGIFGDYDVDGASSTALLAKYFLSIKQKIKTYIPDRQKEGYGPSISGFKNLISDKTKIIFTVDCGTSSFEPINYAKKVNVDVIVLDHHQSDTKLPNACAIINPNRYDDTSGLNYLCAAGVCFVFLVGLNKKLRDNKWFVTNNINEPDILKFLDLVSLGTVCDVVPLVGLNRAIVKQGLKVIKNKSNLGLKTLFEFSDIYSQPTVFDIGFKLGPRINAGGRVGKSSHGAEILISDDPKKTYQIAIDLEKSNKERKSIELMLAEKINIEAKKNQKDSVLVLSGDSWHEGIIGIVASRIKEKYNKPTVLISTNNDQAKGSARSILGFDIGAQIIKAVQLGILDKGGGHKMAGGFSLKKNNIGKFKEFLNNNFTKHNINKTLGKNLYLDSIIAPTALNEDFFEEINHLAPFGSGNSEPKFVLEDIKVISANVVGDNHLKLILIGKDGTTFNAFVWNGKGTTMEAFLSKKNKKAMKIAGRMRLNEWRGRRNIEFMVEDLSIN